MANYFQDPSQSFVPTPVYRPPFEAIQNMVMDKQSLYDKGLANVRSLHNSIFNAPLTNGINSERRSQFLEAADQKLKNLSQVDLSVEANQREAAGVFSPFFKDEAIQRDMSWTQQTGDEISKLNSFKPDKDGMQYADQRNLEYINNGIEKVRNAKSGDLSVYNVRKFVPFTDINKYVSAAAKEQGFAVQKITSNGAVIYRKKNGMESMDNWTTFVDGLTRDRFNDQFQIEATYAKEQGIKREKYKAHLNNPGTEISDEDALHNFVVSNFKDNYTSLDKMYNEYEEWITQATPLLNKFAKEHNEDVDFQKQYDEKYQLIKQKQDIQNQYAEERKKFDTSDPKYQENLKNFLDNPDGGFFEQVQRSTVHNVAATFAANEQQENPTEDLQYKLAYEHQKDMLTETRANQKAQDDHEEHIAKMKHEWDVDGSGGSSASGSGNGLDRNGKPIVRLNPDGTKMSAEDMKLANLEDPMYLSELTSDIQPVDNVQLFKDQQQRRYDQAYNNILSPEGVGGILVEASNGNMDKDDVVTYLSLLNSDKKPADYSQEERKVFAQAKGLFSNNGIKASGDDRYAQGLAIQSLAAKYFGNGTNKDKWNDRTASIMVDYMNSAASMDEYNRYRNIQKGKLKEFVNDSNYKGLIVGNKDNPRVLTGKDIKDHFKGITAQADTYVNPTSGLPIFMGDYWKISGQKAIDMNQFADDYVKGNIEIRGNTVGSPGEHLTIKTKGKPDQVINDRHSMQLLFGFQKQYGKSSDIGKKIAKLDKNTIATIPGYTSDNIGEMNQHYRFNFGEGKYSEEKAVRIIEQATQVGNSGIPKVNGVENEDLKPLIQKIATWGPDVIKELMNPPEYISRSGQSSIVLSFKPIGDDTFRKRFSLNPDLIKNPIEIPLTNSKAKDLQGLIHPGDGFYLYGKITKGESIHASQMEKSMNFNFAAVPNDRTHPTAVEVTIKRKSLDPETGKMVDEDPFVKSYSLADYNPDNIMAGIKQTYIQHINRNTAVQKQLEITKPVDKQTKQANLDWLEQYKKENNIK